MTTRTQIAGLDTTYYGHVPTQSALEADMTRLDQILGAFALALNGTIDATTVTGTDPKTVLDGIVALAESL